MVVGHVRRRAGVIVKLILLLLSCLSLLPKLTPQVNASGILSDVLYTSIDYLFPIDEDDNVDDDIDNYNDDTQSTKKKTPLLDIVSISAMRPREIKRRLARYHGYDPDELSRMIDKKDLINALSFEEHKARQHKLDKRKWRQFRNTVIYTLLAITAVIFWPLLKHAIDVGYVNLVVYSDRRKYEMKRCRDYHTSLGYFGIFLLFIIDILALWLSTSVLLSWVMSSKYFFPVPNLSIRPVQLLTPTGGNAGALGNFGINVGPMLISWLLRFCSSQVEAMIGKACQNALKKQKQKERADAKEARRLWRAAEKEEAKRARRAKEKRREERRMGLGVNEFSSSEEEEEELSDGDVSYCGMTPSNVVKSNMPTVDDLD
jgi:hypothetical protein